MIKTLAFIAYPVRDLQNSRRFYEGVLGLKLARNPSDDWFEYDLGDTTFVISSSDAAHPTPVQGALLAFEVDDLDSELESLKKNGVTVKGEPGESPFCRYVTVLDPDGTELLIHQRKPG